MTEYVNVNKLFKREILYYSSAFFDETYKFDKKYEKEIIKKINKSESFIWAITNSEFKVKPLIKDDLYFYYVFDDSTDAIHFKLVWL